jgi:hypothetical protein
MVLLVIFKIKRSSVPVTVTHPETLWGATSMTDLDASATSDVFTTPRYAELVENPIMYAKPDYTTFTVDGMDFNWCVLPVWKSDS